MAKAEDESVLDEEPASKLYLFYSLAWTEIESVLYSLTTDCVFDSGYESKREKRFEDPVNELIDAAGTFAQLEFLYQMGVIDGQLKRDLEKTRSIRNRMVHESVQRYQPDGEFAEWADSTFEAVQSLLNALFDSPSDS